MTALAEFVHARIDDRQTEARAVQETYRVRRHGRGSCKSPEHQAFKWAIAAAHDWTRLALIDCETDRMIVKALEAADELHRPGLERAVECIARRWDTHPDFDAVWAEL